MEKSKIIIDFTECTTELSVILKKLIVLFNDLGDNNLINWIRSEFRGYASTDNIPSYRRIRGVICGTYIVGDMKYSNASIPIATLPQDISNELIHELMPQSVKSLENMLNNYQERGSMIKPISPELFPILESTSNIQILEAHKQFDLGKIQDIISKLSDKILEILLLLEKEFGNLDSLGIDLNNKSMESTAAIINNINLIIYDDKSIKIGDNNNIKSSNFNSKKM